MTDLFDDPDALPRLSLNAALIVELANAYRERLLLNPPTPAFMETNPRREAAARHTAKRDIDRLIAVLEEKGLTIVRAQLSPIFPGNNF